jgi:hypothetical protein
MMTRLVEFRNHRQIILRGILNEIEHSSSNVALVCIAGFEGVSTTAPKFVHLIQQLRRTSTIPYIFRYDPTGIGLSDGEYHTTTLDALVDFSTINMIFK